MIRGSKTDQQKAGVRRTLVATSCDLCPVYTLATWLDLKEWHPHSGEFLFNRRIAYRVNPTLKALASEHGLDEKRFPTHSMRAGRAPTLYAAGIDPIDIQRWGRWKSAIYTRYIWHDNLRLQHISEALTSTTKLAEHLRVDTEMSRRVNFPEDVRSPSSHHSAEAPSPSDLLKYDFFPSP